MGHELTKIVYKPSPEGNEEFIIIVNPVEVCARDFQPDLELMDRICMQYKRWKEGGVYSQFQLLHLCRHSSEPHRNVKMVYHISVSCD